MSASYMYKLCNDPSIELTIENLVYKVNIPIDDNISYEADAITIAEARLGLADLLAPLFEMSVSEILTMIDESMFYGGEEENYFLSNDNLTQSSFQIINNFIYLVGVAEAGTYTFRNTSQYVTPNSHTVDLEAGWYAILNTIDGEGFIPIGYSSTVRLPEKYIPERIMNLVTRVSNLEPLDVDLVNIPVYDPEATYYEGEVVTRTYYQYICQVSSTTGEWNPEDWNKISEEKQYCKLCYKNTTQEIPVSILNSAFEACRPVRIGVAHNGQGRMNYVDHEAYSITHLTNQITFLVPIGMDMYIHFVVDTRRNVNNDLEKRDILTYMPYIEAQTDYPIPYAINWSTATFDQVNELLGYDYAKRVYWTGSSGYAEVIAHSGRSSMELWLIVYNGNKLEKLTITNGNTKTQTNLISFGDEGYGKIAKKNSDGGLFYSNLVSNTANEPTDTNVIWVDNDGNVKIYYGWDWHPIVSAMWCTLTESNSVYSCNKTPQEIYKAFTAGTPVYINYMGVKVPVTNAVYNQQDDEYYISATITSVIGEELIGRRIGFDGTIWSIDFNDSFIVRGAGSLANIGKYLKATANGVMWDTPEGGGGGNANALEAEEMMALFADTGLNETAGLEYNEYVEDTEGNYIYDDELGDYRLLDQSDPDDFYVEDEEGDYVYDETLHEYRPYVEGDTGTRYSLRQRYDYVDSGFAGYVEYVEDENGDYVWDEDTQTYILLDTTDPDAYYVEDEEGDYVYDETLHEYRLYVDGDTGTRYSLRTRYSVGDTYLITY